MRLLSTLWPAGRRKLCDPDENRFRSQRFRDSFSVLSQLIPCLIGLRLVHLALLMWINVTVRSALPMLIPIGIMSSIIVLCKTALKEKVEQNIGAVVTVLWCMMSMNMLAAAFTASNGDEESEHVVRRHRVFLVAALITKLVIATLGYIPDLWHFCFITPVYFLSWIMFHVRMACLDAPVFFAGVAVWFCALVLRASADAAQRDKFEALQRIERARECIEAHLAAQESMWKSIFDATVTCDASGNVAHASAQAVDLFGRGALVGSCLGSLAASETESRRLLEVLRGAVASPRQAMICQATFSVAGGAQLDLQLNAVRIATGIPDAADAAAADEWGILIGLRIPEPKLTDQGGGSGAEASCGARDSPVAPQAQADALPGTPSEEEDHFIEFETLSPNLDVLDYSDGIWGTTGLLDMVPHNCRANFASWVSNQTRFDGQPNRPAAGRIAVEGLRLRHPKPYLCARTAWISCDVDAFFDEDMHVTRPARLHFEGVTKTHARRRREERSICRLPSISEGNVGTRAASTRAPDSGSLQSDDAASAAERASPWGPPAPRAARALPGDAAAAGGRARDEHARVSGSAGAANEGPGAPPEPDSTDGGSSELSGSSPLSESASACGLRFRRR